MTQKVQKGAFPDQLFQKECNNTEILHTTYSHLLNCKDQLQKKYALIIPNVTIFLNTIR